MEYIVLDLEWNQSNTGKEDAVEKLPFEIIEIGAIKLNKERVGWRRFCQMVRTGGAAVLYLGDVRPYGVTAEHGIL